MGFVRPDLAPNGTKWSADGGHSGGQAYKTVGFWVGIMCGLGFIGLAVYCSLYLKRHYERVAVERPRARANAGGARRAEAWRKFPPRCEHPRRASVRSASRAGLNSALRPAARPVVVLPCKHAFHAKCLENWFATSLARLSDADDLTCPLCRQAVPAAPRRRLDGEEHKDATGDVELRGGVVESTAPALYCPSRVRTVATTTARRSRGIRHKPTNLLYLSTFLTSARPTSSSRSGYLTKTNLTRSATSPPASPGPRRPTWPRTASRARTSRRRGGASSSAACGASASSSGPTSAVHPRGAPEATRGAPAPDPSAATRATRSPAAGRRWGRAWA